MNWGLITFLHHLVRIKYESNVDCIRDLAGSIIEVGELEAT
jgi:hypothetical protein